MESNIKNKRKWIFFLIVLDILLISCIVFFIYPKLNDNSPSVSIIEETDGRTTIYIASHYLNKYIFALIFIIIDLIILFAIKIVEYIKNKKLKLIYGTILIIVFNLIIAIILFPGTLIIAIILNIIIAIIFIIKYLLNKNDKNKSNGI